MPGDSVDGLRHSAQRTGREVRAVAKEAAASPWAEPFSRLGYIAKGTVYGIVGVLALQVALGIGGETADVREALQIVMQQPFGIILLLVLTIGLLGYAFWEVVRGILDPERRGSTLRGLLERAGNVITGLGYSSLALLTAGSVIGLVGDSTGGTRDWTALGLAQPFGPWLVGLAGLVIIVGGLSPVAQAYTREFRRHFKTSEMAPAELTWATHIAQFGLVARGVVFCLIGGFVVYAALTADPDKAQDLDGVLDILLHQAYGRWNLGLVALGFIAYAVYNVIEARYHRIELDDT